MLLGELDVAVTPPHELNPIIPEGLSDIILKAVAEDPNDRFQTAKDMRLEIEKFMLQHFMFPEQDALAEYLCEIYSEAARHRWW